VLQLLDHDRALEVGVADQVALVDLAHAAGAQLLEDLVLGGLGHGAAIIITASVRLLGLDVGDKRIGIALSDESATLASGLDTLQRVGPRKDLKAIAALVREHSVSDVVVGLPRRLDGSLGEQAQKVLQFMDELREVVKVPVVSWDERFTSSMATQALIEGNVSRRDRKSVVDKVAATLILQSYLDYKKVHDAEANEPSV
jgi:putative Holliday junction resolvase